MLITFAGVMAIGRLEGVARSRLRAVLRPAGPSSPSWSEQSRKGARGRHDAVFGPADDGGYWRVGLRRRPVQPDLFHPVRWSTSHALADTIANLGYRFSHTLVEMLVDVDDAAAMSRWLTGRRNRSQAG